jgi:NAD(P)-dependent dehydrogenase (short-subunit alcohol dehydrogenase family)
MEKVAVVTGSSSGIGYEASLLLARNHYTTFATMRNTNKGYGLREMATKERIPLKVTQLDVNDDSSVDNAIYNILREYGKIDVLVNNAGYDMSGPLEELSLEEIKQQFETNFFGAIRTTKGVISTMRKRRSGVIVNVSSVGGRLGLFPFTTAYHASKFALEGLTESLRHEVAEFNISIILIEPGIVRSNLMDNLKTAKGFDPNKSPYAKAVQQAFQGYESISAYASQPMEVAHTILNAVNSPTRELRYPVGKDAESILNARTELTDIELERWVRESYMEKKGFIRQ